MDFLSEMAYEDRNKPLKHINDYSLASFYILENVSPFLMMVVLYKRSKPKIIIHYESKNFSTEDSGIIRAKSSQDRSTSINELMTSQKPPSFVNQWPRYDSVYNLMGEITMDRISQSQASNRLLSEENIINISGKRFRSESKIKT